MSPEKFDLKAWLVGFALGLAGKPLPFAKPKQTPVAYLYNGVRLPPLPEWDREKYLYVYIWAVGWTHPSDYITMYKLDVCSSPIRYGMVDGELSAYLEAGTESAMYNCPKTDGEFKAWEYHSEYVLSKTAKVYPFWTNHDVISDTDGSVYYAASDPVPVYE